MISSTWSTKSFLGGAAAVLAARLAYLARFGWDIGWMNLAYLDHARLLALGRTQVAEEQPLAYFALVGARSLGLSALRANEAVYLLAHLALALGTLGLACFIWPQATRRRRLTLIATLALVPLLAAQSGRNNLGVTLAAGLTAGALALATRVALVPRTPATRGPALVLLVLLAAAASSGRYEGLAACAAGAILLWFFGRRMPGAAHPRRAALALAAGALTGTAAVLLIRRALAGSATAEKTYAFYTFYDGLPLLMYPHLPGTEYGRYRAAVTYLGSFADNHGSLVHALLHHPGFALLRFLTKPIDMLAVLLWLYGLTPIGVGLATLGVRGIVPVPRPGLARAWILAAYALPLGMLLIPQQNPAYYVSIAVPLVLALARGADRLAGRLGPQWARALAAVTLVAALAITVGMGKLGVTNSRAINLAVPYLEERCHGGCLTNVLPQALRAQTWVETESGAPLPALDHRNERMVSPTTAPPRHDYDYCARVRRARAGGFAGPVLYVDARIRTFAAFDPDFDPELRYQGNVDLSPFVEERRFREGPDEVVIYHLGPERSCQAAGGERADPSRQFRPRQLGRL